MKIQKINLKEQTYNLIKTRILNREYKLGEQIVITQLSEEIGISNTPIREALSYLESEGLVVFVDGKYKVVELKGREVRDLNVAMCSQLLSALNIVVENNKLDKLIELEKQSLNEQEKLINTDSKINYEYVRTFVNFNRNIVLVAENKYLLKVFDNLYSVLILATSYNKKEYRNKNYAQHVDIYEALVKNNIEKAKEIIQNLFDKDEDAIELSIV